jgi:hypothetical protein
VIQAVQEEKREKEWRRGRWRRGETRETGKMERKMEERKRMTRTNRGKTMLNYTKRYTIPLHVVTLPGLGERAEAQRRRRTGLLSATPL